MQLQLAAGNEHEHHDEHAIRHACDAAGRRHEASRGGGVGGGGGLRLVNVRLTSLCIVVVSNVVTLTSVCTILVVPTAVYIASAKETALLPLNPVAFTELDVTLNSLSPDLTLARGVGEANGFLIQTHAVKSP